MIVCGTENEWMELKNISGSELDISNWQILDKEEQIKIAFPENTKISAGGFLLLERTDDHSVPNVTADIIYTGALSNSDEGLRLFDEQCNLIDEAMASNVWSAGDSSIKKTMERQPDLSWGTYIGSGEGAGNELILGTPKKENSLRVISYGGGGGSAAAVSDPQPTVTDQQPSPAKLLISEIQITGGTGKSNNDFIEIYNPNDSRVNLKGYRLVKRTKTGTTDTGIKSWTDDAYVEAESFYLWANSDYTDISVMPNATTTATLANDNGVALRFGAEDTGTIIDSAAWGEAANAFIESDVFSQDPGAGQSIQRKFQNNLFIDTDNNSSDFELTGCPNPKAQSRFCAVSETNGSNQAPSAFFDFSILEPKVNEEIIFNAASSTDPDGNIVLYEWNFGDLSTDSGRASSTQATTTHSYLLAGTYNISLTVFDNSNAASTYALPLSVASSTIQKDEEFGRILISEIMAGSGSGRSDEEFIELYNPNDAAVDLTGYSLRKKTSVAAASSTPLVSAVNFSGEIIPAKGFLLITSLNYLASSTADLIYSSGSYGLANDNDQLVLLLNSVGETADEVYYVSIPEGKSLERKALSDNSCVSAQGEGEFLGNGCDGINDLSAEGEPSSGWEIRDIPNPQNSLSLPEPRNKPTDVTNFVAQYDKSNKKINLSWDASSDHSGAASTLSYLISDISANSILGGIETASTTAEFNIVEIGRDYVFEIKAVDKEGWGSETASTSVSVADVSIEDVNYFLLNKTGTGETMSLSDRIFKPLATGVIDSMSFDVGVSYNQNIPGSSSDVDISLYEWLGGATTTPELGRGRLLARSGIRTVYNHTCGLTFNFSDENKVVLDSGKYYYFEANITASGLSIRWRPYVVIKADSAGIIGISSPTGNYVYGDPNIDISIKYLEPFNNKYDAVVAEISDFYTNAVIDNYRVDLAADQKIIGWHDLATTTKVLAPGFYKVKTTLNCSDPCESKVVQNEVNFSVFGAAAAGGKLLDQKSYSNSIPESQFSGQVFRPVVSGLADSLTIMAIANGSNVYHGYNYWSVYEWDGDGNSLAGSRGDLLATTSPLYSTSDSFMEMSWNFGDNDVYLDSSKYYFLTLDKETNGGQVPRLTMKMTNNGSLIDGRLIGQYINQGDLYLIINAAQAQ